MKIDNLNESYFPGLCGKFVELTFKLDTEPREKFGGVVAGDVCGMWKQEWNPKSEPMIEMVACSSPFVDTPLGRRLFYFKDVQFLRILTVSNTNS